MWRYPQKAQKCMWWKIFSYWPPLYWHCSHFGEFIYSSALFLNISLLLSRFYIDVFFKNLYFFSTMRVFAHNVVQWVVARRSWVWFLAGGSWVSSLCGVGVFSAWVSFYILKICVSWIKNAEVPLDVSVFVCFSCCMFLYLWLYDYSDWLQHASRPRLQISDSDNGWMDIQ